MKRGSNTIEFSKAKCRSSYFYDGRNVIARQIWYILYILKSVCIFGMFLSDSKNDSKFRINLVIDFKGRLIFQSFWEKKKFQRRFVDCKAGLIHVMGREDCSWAFPPPIKFKPFSHRDFSTKQQTNNKINKVRL